MTTIKTKTPLVDLKGELLTDPATQEQVLVGDVIANILTLNAGVENPARAYQFAKKFANEDTVDLKAEDIVYLKKQIEAMKNLPALTAGQIIELLDN